MGFQPVGQRVGERKEGFLAGGQLRLPAAAGYLDLGKGQQLGLEHEGVGAAVDDTDVVPRISRRGMVNS